LRDLPKIFAVPLDIRRPTAYIVSMMTNASRATETRYLTSKNGYTTVYANRAQAERTAANLRRSGINAHAVQSYKSMRFVVMIEEWVN
jgi:hypothetical protein